MSRSAARRWIVSLAVVFLLAPLCACSVTRDCVGGCTVSVDSPTGTETDDLGGFVPLLQSFDLGFAGSDQELRSIAVGSLRDSPTAEPRFHLELRDGDGGDRVVGSARYYRWSEGSRVFFGLPEDSRYGIQQFAEQRDCRSSCDLVIEDFAADDVLVITGFRFRFPDGENNLRRIGLEWRDSVVRATHRDDDGSERFDVELSYVLFPWTWSNRGRLVGNDVLAGPETEVALDLEWRGRIPLLSGFFLGYVDGDEPVKALGIDGTDERIVLKLRDDDGTERIAARARYSGFCEAPLDENVQIQECPPR